MKMLLSVEIEGNGKTYSGGIDASEWLEEYVNGIRSESRLPRDRDQIMDIFVSWFQRLGEAGVRTMIKEGMVDVMLEAPVCPDCGGRELIRDTDVFADVPCTTCQAEEKHGTVI